MSQLDKKLDETRFFLGELTEQAQLAFGNPDVVDFYLSAFHSAGRSVVYKVQASSNKRRHKDLYDKWEAGLLSNDKVLMDFMKADRDLEVHYGESQREITEVRITQFGSYEYGDKSGTLTSSAPPGTPSYISKRVYTFSINGEQRPMIDTCRRYAELLGQLVADHTKWAGQTDP